MLAHVDLKLAGGPTALPAVVGVLEAVIPFRGRDMAGLSASGAKFHVQVSEEKSAKMGDVSGASAAADSEGSATLRRFEVFRIALAPSLSTRRDVTKIELVSAYAA